MGASALGFGHQFSATRWRLTQPFHFGPRHHGVRFEARLIRTRRHGGQLPGDGFQFSTRLLERLIRFGNLTLKQDSGGLLVRYSSRNASNDFPVRAPLAGAWRAVRGGSWDISALEGNGNATLKSRV